MRRAGLTLLCVAALAASGCATVVRGTSENFRVETVPPGATVTTTLPDDRGGFRGCAPTPCDVRVPRRGEFIARIDLPDHQTLRVIVRSTGSDGAFGLSTIGGAGTVAASTVGYAAATTGGGLAIGATGATFLAGVGGVFASPLIFLDAATGALSSVAPNPVNVELPKLETGVEPQRFIDPQALPSRAEALALAAARNEVLERVADAPEALRPVDVDPELAARVAELEAASARYRTECRPPVAENARQVRCEALRERRRELRADITARTEAARETIAERKGG